MPGTTTPSAIAAPTSIDTSTSAFRTPAARSEELRAAVAFICENVAVLRAWWEQVGSVIEQLMPGLTGNAHEAFVHANIDAWQLARAVGHKLRDYSDFDWSPTVPLANCGEDPFDR